MSGKPLLELRGIKKYYAVNSGLFGQRKKGTVKAVNDVSLFIEPGETLGLIGESGCGKSTLARVLMGLTQATAGEIHYRGQRVEAHNRMEMYKHIQMVFQDPYSSLDPRMSICRTVEEPLRIHTKLSRKERLAKSMPLLEQLGFDADCMSRFPHEFSGGQRQRIGIARALILSPSVLICDEPVSALDMSIQAQILNLFKDIQRERGVTYLFISHDMSVVKHVSNRIAVMYLGQLVELAEKEQLFANTLHPYSMALMSAIPVPNPAYKRKRILLEGDLPSPLALPTGCPFVNRCVHAMPKCHQTRPALMEREPGHFVACHLYGEGGKLDG